MRCVDRFGRVGVLCGGPSSEREISLKSGNTVYEALTGRGIDAVLIDVHSSADIIKAVKCAEVDTVFIALHGGFGEDGTIQRILEDVGIPYTGSGPEASRLAIDKLASRHVFEKTDMAVPKYRILRKKDDISAGGLKMPIVVKPQREGSSVGLSVVYNNKQLKGAADKAFLYGDNILIEEFIGGRELTVGILDDEPLFPIEIVPEGGCYDYHAKYESSVTRYLVPAPVEKRDFNKAQHIGLKAHKVLGCRSFSRVDMILGCDGTIYILEVNTIPGLTPRSLLPKAAKAAGIDFYKLCRKILKGASHTD